MPKLLEEIGKSGKSRLALVLATGLLLVTVMLVRGPFAWPEAGLHTFTGEIQDSTCAGTAPHVESECALRCVHRGAKWVLYNPSSNEVHQLDHQETLSTFAAQQINILGFLDKSNNTIHIIKIVPQP